MKSPRIVMASRPVGEPVEAGFRVETKEIWSPAEGELLLKTLYLSLDPYMRGRMSDEPSYAAPVQVNVVMTGATVCKVLEPREDGFSPGDTVLAFTDGRDTPLCPPRGIRKLYPSAGFATALNEACPSGIDVYFSTELFRGV